MLKIYLDKVPKYYHSSINFGFPEQRLVAKRSGLGDLASIFERRRIINHMTDSDAFRIVVYCQYNIINYHFQISLKIET